MMTEWSEFRERGLSFRSSLFMPIDVDPDGNCFYHSVIASQAIPNVTSPTQLRQQLVRSVLELIKDNEWKNIFTRIYASYNPRVDFYAYLQQILRNGTWGTDMEMTFIYIVFGINVISLTNAPFGLVPFCAKSSLAQQLHIQMPAGFVELDDKCIYLYHHAYGHPLTPTHSANHFCVLFPVTNGATTKSLAEKAYMGGLRVQHGCLDNLMAATTKNNVKVGASSDGLLSKCNPPTSTTQKSLNAVAANVPKENKMPSVKVVPAKVAKEKKQPSVKVVAAKVAKEKKQSTLMKWLPNVPPATEKQLSELRAGSIVQEGAKQVGETIVIDGLNTFSNNETATDLLDSRCAPVMTQSSQEDGDISSRRSGRKGTSQLKGQQRHEVTWTTKAIFIYFHLHPFFANKDFNVTCTIFKLKAMTIRNWLVKRERIVKWLGLVEQLSFDEVLAALPMKIRSAYQSVVKEPYPALDVARFRRMLEKTKTPRLVVNGKMGNSARSISAYAKVNSDKAVYIRANSKRIVTVKPKQKLKHTAVYNFVKTTIEERWKQGLAITKPELKLMVMKEFGDKRDEESRLFAQTYLNVKQEKGYAKLHIFLDRAVRRAGYSIRQSSISQKIPINWRSLAEQGARRVRETFRKEEVDVVVAADEMFIRFHEEDTRVLAPTGEKRIGKSVTCDKKAGCTVLPTMDMLNSRLLPPMIIFNGVFGGRLMKEWAQHTNSFVLFTEKHWMTTETMVLYLKKLTTFYKGQKIGVIIDKAPSHTNDTVYEWVNKLNAEATDGTKIVLEWVDGGLTSVYQPGDITVNKPLKTMIKNQYYKYVTENKAGFRPGEKIRVSREKLVEFIEASFAEFNETQRKKRGIAQSFRTCGLDPFAENDRDFVEHLNKLEGCKVYANLITHEDDALVLDRIVTGGGSRGDQNGN